MNKKSRKETRSPDNEKRVLADFSKVLFTFNHLFDEGLLGEALRLIRMETTWNRNQNAAWRIMELVEDHMAKGFRTDAPNRYDLSSQMLCHLAREVDGEEGTEQLLGYIDGTLNDMQLVYTLMAIQVTLLKITAKRGKWLDKCFKVIRCNMLATHPVPGANDDQSAMNKFVLNFTYVLKNVIEFYDPFLVESSPKGKSSLSKRHAAHQKRKVTVFLLQLLGKPFMYLDLQDKTLERKLASVMVSDLTKIVSDCFQFLDIVDQREIDGVSVSVNAEFESPDDVPTVALANMYYLILAEGMSLEKAPCVYDPVYVWLNATYLATSLITLGNDCQNAVTLKGLLLFTRVTSRFKDLSIPHQVLEAKTHKAFTKALADLDANPHAQAKNVKDLIAECLKLYVFKLDWRGRYLLLFNVVLDIREPSFVVRFTSLLLSVLSDGLKTQPMSPYFSGRRLLDLLSCYAQVGQRDIVEGHHQVVETLKIFLFLKTNDAEDASGLLKHAELFRSKFFLPLTKELVACRTEYEARIKDLKHVLRLAPRKKLLDFPKSMQDWVTTGQMERETWEKIAEAEEALHRFDSVDCWLKKIMVGSAINSQSYMKSKRNNGASKSPRRNRYF